MPREPTKVKKYFVRNAESKPTRAVVVPESSNHRNRGEGGIEVKDLVNKKLVAQPRRHDFSRPELHSTLSVAKHIEHAKRKITTAKDRYLGERSSDSQNDAKSTITRKLNFHVNNQIYKDLVALHMHDSDAIPRQRKPHGKYFAPSAKDMEPKLEDFYDLDTYSDEALIVAAARPKQLPRRKYSNTSLYHKFRAWDTNNVI